MALHLFAGLRVREFAEARTWYERLLGEPAFFPHATEADPDGNELDFGGTPVEAG